MQEIELKFLIPEARLTGLLRQAKVKSSQTIQLAAHYYDTPKQALAKAGIGLRIRPCALLRTKCLGGSFCTMGWPTGLQQFFSQQQSCLRNVGLKRIWGLRHSASSRCR